MPTDPVPPMAVHTRSGEDAVAEPFEKPVILPAAGDNDPARHALFLDRTRHEAERWTQRLQQLGNGESELDRTEVAAFWDTIMEEHARFVAHLLDPDEGELIAQATRTSKVFAELGAGGPGGATAALAAQPGMVARRSPSIRRPVRC